MGTCPICRKNTPSPACIICKGSGKVSPLSASQRVVSLERAKTLPPDEAKKHSSTRLVASLGVQIRVKATDSSDVSSEGIEEFIDGAVRHLFDAIHAYGGRTFTYTATEMIAFFGHPVPYDDSLLRAASAALQTQEALERYAAELEVSHQLYLFWRMGLSASPINSAREEASLASSAGSICKQTPKREIWVTNVVRQALDQEFIFEDQDGEELSRLYRRQELRATNNMLARRLTPLSGREKELEYLLEMLAKATAGEGAVVAVRGSLGLGKSRLGLEVSQAAQNIGARVVEGRCPTSEKAVPMAAWSEVARQLGRPQAASGPREESYRKILSLLRSAASNTPLLILLEDAEHADLTTEQLCVYLDAHLSGVKLLILYLTRSATHPLVQKSVSLTPLSKENARKLLIGTLGVPEISEEIAVPLLERAEGNPLILEELITGLLHSGDLVVEGGRAILTRNELDTIPSGFSAIVLDRLQRLPESARQLVKFASVLGRQFHRITLEALLDRPGREVGEDLEAAFAAGLFEPRGPSFPGSYRFRHALTQESLYREIPEEERTALHAKALGAMLSESNPAASGHHAFSAGRLDDAYPLLLEAARQALRGYAYREAVSHFNRALIASESLPDKDRQSRQLDIYEGRGTARLQIHDIEGAITDFHQMAEAAKALNNRVKEGEAFASLASAYLSRFVDPTHQDALDAANAAEAAALEANDDLTLAKARVNIGLVHQSLGDLRVSDQIFAQTLSLCEQRQLPWGQARSRFWLSANSVWRGEFRQALAWIEPAFSLLAHSPDGAMELQLHFFRALALAALGEYSQALAAMDASCAVGDHIGNGFARARRPNLVGWIRFEFADFASARLADEEGVEISRALNFRHPEISSLVNLGRDFSYLGEYEQARDTLEQIRRRVEREGDGSHRWRWLLRISHAQTELERLCSRFDTARDLGLQTLSYSLKTGSLKYISLAYLELGLIALSCREWQAASAHFVAAAEVAVVLQSPALHFQIQPHLAELREQQQREQEAEYHRQIAKDALAQMLAGAPDEAARESLLQSPQGKKVNSFPTLEAKRERFHS